jgi:hypothetical protein
VDEKAQIWFKYLNDTVGIHRKPRSMVNTINSDEDTRDILVRKHAEFFKPPVLAAHRGDMDFSIMLKKEFCLHPTRPTRLTIQQQKSLRATVNDLLRDRIIIQIATEFTSLVVIVKKKDGTDRICVDYCELNSLTVRDIHPLPII